MLNELLDTQELATTRQGDRVTALFDKEHIRDMHNIAFVYYKNHCYQQADTFFRILVIAEPQNFKFWKGLGACMQMKKDYQGALNCYKRVDDLLDNQSDAYIDIHCADCFFALGQIKDGLKALSSAKQKALKKADKKVLQHVSFMRERWKEEV